MLPEMKTEKTNIAKPGGITLPGFSYAHILNYNNGKNRKKCRIGKGGDMMNQKEILGCFRPGEIFGKNQFRETIHGLNREYTEASVNWLLGK